MNKSRKKNLASGGSKEEETAFLIIRSKNLFRLSSTDVLNYL